MREVCQAVLLGSARVGLEETRRDSGDSHTQAPAGLLGAGAAPQGCSQWGEGPGPRHPWWDVMAWPEGDS